MHDLEWRLISHPIPWQFDKFVIVIFILKDVSGDGIDNGYVNYDLYPGNIYIFYTELLGSV